MSSTRAKVFTGAVPFSGETSCAARSAIVGGERPSRPTHPALTDKLWMLTQRCWDQDVDRRPNAQRVSCLYVLTRNGVYLG